MFSFFKKISSFFIIILILFSFFGVRQTQAFWGIGDIVFNPDTFSKEFILDIISQVSKQMLIQNITKSTVDWINRDFGGDPGFVQNPKLFFLDIANEVSGRFIEEVGASAICEPFRPSITIALARSQTFYERSACTLLDAVDNIEDFYNDFSEGGWAGWISMTQNPANNPYGAYLITIEEHSRLLSLEDKNARDEISSSQGFIPLKKCEPDPECAEESGLCEKICFTTTPGVLISDQLNKSLGLGADSLIVADELNEVIAALANYAYRKLTEGVAQTSKYTSGTSSYGYSSGSGGISEIKGYIKKSCRENPFCLSREISEMKYNLYDIKIIKYDSKFKPGINNEDNDAYALYSEIYKNNFGLDYENNDCDLQSDQTCGFGILSYGEAGTSIVDKTPRNIGWREKAELWFLEIVRERYLHALDDANETRHAIADIRIQGGESLLYCRVKDKIKTGGEALDMLKRDLNNYDFGNMNEIKDYFGEGGTYESLIAGITKAEQSLKQLCPQAYDPFYIELYNNGEDLDKDDCLPEGVFADKLDVESTVEILGEQMMSLKSRVPSVPVALTDRLDALMYYQETDLGILMGEDDCFQNKCNNITPEVEFTGEHDVFGARPENNYAEGNMHCWGVSAAKDEYCSYSETTRLEAKDTCNGDIVNTFSCGPTDSGSCLDTYAEVSGGAGGSGGSGGSTGSSGGSGSPGEAGKTTYVKRTVVCRINIDAAGSSKPNSLFSGDVDPKTSCSDVSVGNGGGVGGGGGSFNPSQYAGYTLSECQTVRDQGGDYGECLVGAIGSMHGLALEYQLTHRCQWVPGLSYRCGFNQWGQVYSCLENVYNNKDYFCPGNKDQSGNACRDTNNSGEEGVCLASQ